MQDLLANSRVTLLVDRWDEDWSRLAWVRAYGTATLLERADDPAEHDLAVTALRAKYRQYLEHALESRPIIRIAVDRVVSWGALSAET